MRATDAQVLDDAGRLIATCNQGQAKRMPMRFSPTIGVAIAARYRFLWICQLAGRSMQLPAHPRPVPRRSGSELHFRAVVPTCRPNAPFAELVRLSRTSITDEMRVGHRRRVIVE
jgi:hypothetical protein